MSIFILLQQNTKGKNKIIMRKRCRGWNELDIDIQVTIKIPSITLFSWCLKIIGYIKENQQLIHSNRRIRQLYDLKLFQSWQLSKGLAWWWYDNVNVFGLGGIDLLHCCWIAAAVGYCCSCRLLLLRQTSTGTCYCQCVWRYGAMSI